MRFGLKEVLSRRYEIARLPKELSKTMAGYYLAQSVYAVVSQLYCFVLNGATNAVENGAIFWGISLYLIYTLRATVCKAIYVWVETYIFRMDEATKINVAERAVSAMAKVSGKVIYQGKYVSNSALLTNINAYIKRYRLIWQRIVQFAISFTIFLVSIVGMIATAVSKFDNMWLFTSTILVAILLNVVISYKRTKLSRDLYSQIKDLERKAHEQKNACVNVRHACEEHSAFMLSRYVKTLKEISKREVLNLLKSGIIDIGSYAVAASAIIVIVVDTIIAVGYENINAVTFMQIISLATIFSSVLNQIQSKIQDYQYIVSKNAELSEEAPLFDEIMKVYALQAEEESGSNFMLRPFEFSYPDGEFTLKNERSLSFSKGEMVLIRGDNAAGKSTLMKLLCGDINFERIPKLRAIKYSCKSHFGCEPLLDEITFGNTLDREKLLYILKGAQIYDLLIAEAKGQDIFEYLQSGRERLSDGMEAKLMLARILYNLDAYDLVIIDEPIGEIDIQSACKLIAFIREYAARKMQKLVLVTTHQHYAVEDQFDKIIDVKREGCVSRIN